MAAFFLWLILLLIAPPVAIFALVLYPVVWLLLLPFRILGVAVDGILRLMWLAITLPVRLLSGFRR